ncbi:MAG: heavy metal translocating P-type ATPase [Marinosulfonomonas sp.]|nr:MAG: heavy metal translocating P-type ATPase [Marinosulfonomonas sp.]
MPTQQILRIEGMDCASCTNKIEAVVCKIPGVENVSLNYTSQKIKFQLGKTDGDAKPVIRAIEKLGYKVMLPKAKQADVVLAWWQTGKGRLVIFAGILVVIAGVMSLVLPAYANAGFAVASLVALFPLARKAALGTLSGQPFSIETLVTIAVIGAIIIGESAEAAVVVFLFSIGELLEMVAAAKARRSVQALADLVPKTAVLVTDEGFQDVQADTLVIGDLIEIRPGARVPADGVITQGQTTIDEAAVTGESMPKRKTEGDTVFAGSINVDGLIRLTVENEAENNMIARILQMVEDAEANKAPTARFIDNFSKYYTPGVIVVAALVAIIPPLMMGAEWTPSLYKALAILLIGCPCALVLSTPAAITSGISAGARHGLLMKGGAVLEAIGKVTKVAFDKTGTLTRGNPTVTDIRVFAGQEDEMLALAGAVESGSLHPLALAIVNEVESRNIALVDTTDAKALSGRGVEATVGGKVVTIASPNYGREISKFSARQNRDIEALEEQGKTVAAVIVDGVLTGLFAMRDELRKDAQSAMQALEKMGVSAIMLTGDNQRTGAALGAQLGIEVKAELLPQDKLGVIQTLKEQGSIAMVGDGINDAPALALADVGIAMGGGTDVALETADAALLHENVGDVVSLIKLSRATMSNIHQNITIALGLKSVFLVTTLLGLTSLWMAILADTGATVLVTINALRLLGYKFNK